MILLSMTIFTFLHLSVLTVKRGAQMAGMNFKHALAGNKAEPNSSRLKENIW